MQDDAGGDDQHRGRHEPTRISPPAERSEQAEPEDHDSEVLQGCIFLGSGRESVSAAGLFPAGELICDDWRVMGCTPWEGRGYQGLGLAGLVALFLAGCVAPAGPAATSEAPKPAPVSAGVPPEWRPGDQWIYTWSSEVQSRTQSGSKSVEVLEVSEINTISYYLVKVGEAEQLYTKDLQWAGTMREGKVQSRMIPPQPWFVWPLESGRRWIHRGTYEDASGKSVRSDSFSVVGAEIVEVPAGRFSTLKVVRETDTRDSDQYWYAPEVRFYVKWVGRRGDQQFEEDLREYRPAQRLIPGQIPSSPPSTTK
jgi:hypothetical protein